MTKTILIAGCDGKVGKATAELFATRGWIVIGIDQKEKTEAMVNQYFRVDVKKEGDVQAAIEKIERESSVDALFNAAGYEICDDFAEISHSQWNDLLETVLGGSANLCRAITPKMIARKNGKIILLSSDYSRESGENILNAM